MTKMVKHFLLFCGIRALNTPVKREIKGIIKSAKVNGLFRWLFLLSKSSFFQVFYVRLFALNVGSLIIYRTRANHILVRINSIT